MPAIDRPADEERPPCGYTLNGKGSPATEPLVCGQGQTVRLRCMNEGMMIHPVHLHGMFGMVTALVVKPAVA